MASENEKARKKSVEKIKALIKYSNEINAEYISIHPGYYSKKSSQRKRRVWNQNLRSFKEITNEAEKHQITIGIENMPNMPWVLGKHPSEIFGLVDSVDSEWLSVSYDMGHANTTNHVTSFLENKNKITHIHLHDNNGEKDQHLAMGEGTINLEESLSFLSNYDGMMVLESRSIEEGLASMKKIKSFL